MNGNVGDKWREWGIGLILDWRGSVEVTKTHREKEIEREREREKEIERERERDCERKKESEWVSEWVIDGLREK